MYSTILIIAYFHKGILQILVLASYENLGKLKYIIPENQNVNNLKSRKLFKFNLNMGILFSQQRLWYVFIYRGLINHGDSFITIGLRAYREHGYSWLKSLQESMIPINDNWSS